MKVAPRYKSLNFRFYVALAAMLLLSVGGGFYIIRSSADHFHKLIHSEFGNTTQGLGKIFSLLGDNISLVLKNVAVDKDFLITPGKAGNKKIQTRIEELERENSVNVVILFDHTGTVVAHSSKRMFSSSAMENLYGVFAGNKSDKGGSFFVSLEKQLIYCQVIRVDSTSSEDSYLMLAGLVVDAAFLRSIQSNRHIDISILLNKQIQTSTKDDFSDILIPELSPAKRPGDLYIDQCMIGGNTYYARFIGFPAEGAKLKHILLLTHSQKDISKLNSKILVNLTIFLALQIVFLCLLGLFFVRNFFSPIREFTEIISKVAKGQYDSRIAVKGSTELNTLAEHFNKMTDFVREKEETLETIVRERTTLLKEKNDFIDNILNSANDIGIVATDIVGNITYVNPTSEVLFNYTATDIIGQPIELSHCSAELPSEVISRGIHDITGTDRFFFTIEQMRDGKPMQIECTVTEMNATDEHFTGYLLLARDVTLAREMDLYLSKAMAELDIIFEHSSLAIVYESKGCVARVNNAFEEMFHFERQEVLGQKWQEFFGTLQIGETDSFWDKKIEAHHVQSKNGKKFWITINKRSPDPDDLKAGVIWIFEDISRQKAAELKIKQLSMAVEQSPNSVVITDTEGTIQYVNPAFIRITGYTFSEAIGQNPSILKSGKTPDAVFKKMWETITSGKGWSGQFINKKKNGELYEEHVTIDPIRNENDEITNFIATKENITKLKDAYRQAGIANQAKSEFLANMSHEIRTPMNLIFGMTELLLDTELHTEQKNFLNHIQNAVTNLLGLINDILDYSKIESGKLIFEQKVMVLEQLFTDLEGTLALAAEKKGIDLEFIVENKSSRYPVGDQLRLHQVLMNLSENAIKFTEEGKVEVKVQIRDSDDNYCIAEFTVKDTGIGIEADKQKDIFESFSQANSSITRKYGGTGLGLAISSKLIALMGGEIELSSAVGLGTMFSFTLSFPTEERVEYEPEKENLPAAPNTSLRVLVVEDNKANQALARLLLLKDKHHVTMSDHGLDALRVLSESHFDVILMDIQMPVMDGLTASSIIRKFEADAPDPLPDFPDLQESLHLALSGKHISIIAMTANAMAGDREKCLSAGIDNYLTKPYSTKQLRAALARVSNCSGQNGDAVLQYPGEEESTVENAAPVSKAIVQAHLEENLSIDKNMIQDIMETVTESLQTATITLSRALEEENMSDVASAAHHLKGALLNLGMKNQAQFTAKIEKYALAEELQDCHIVMKQLRFDLREFLGSVKS